MFEPQTAGWRGADAVRDFLALHHLTHKLLYLTGSPQQLKPVWAHYYIGADAGEVSSAAAAESAGSPDLVTHTTIVYVIDPRGRVRLFLPGSFAPRDLAADLRQLAPGTTR